MTTKVFRGATTVKVVNNQTIRVGPATKVIANTQGPRGPKGEKGDKGEDGAAQIPEVIDGGFF